MAALCNMKFDNFRRQVQTLTPNIWMTSKCKITSKFMTPPKKKTTQNWRQSQWERQQVQGTTRCVSSPCPPYKLSLNEVHVYMSATSTVSPLYMMSSTIPNISTVTTIPYYVYHVRPLYPPCLPCQCPSCSPCLPWLP